MKTWPTCGHDATPYQGHCMTPGCPYYLGFCARHDRNQPALCTLKTLALDKVPLDRRIAMAETDIDHVTWVALAKCYHIAEEALGRISSASTVAHETAEQALKDMRAEVDACEQT